MAHMLMAFEVENFDEWKELFDSDPGGRKAVGKGHRISRAVDNPNQIFLSTEYPSADDARAVLDRLREAGVFDRFRPTLGPTIVEVEEEERY